MSEIVWGPEIAVDGKRPEWLADDDMYIPTDGYHWFEKSRCEAQRKNGELAWDYTIAIRLPANHPHYAAQQPRPAPSGGEVGPEVVDVHDLREARRQDALLWDRMESFVRQYASGDSAVVQRGDGEYRSPYAEAKAIVALLPEPVDADLVEVRRIVADALTGQGTQDNILAGDFDSTPSIQAPLACLKRGRALAAGDR